MNKQRLVILIIAILGMLATFMPWLTIPMIGSVSGARGSGWLVLALYAIPAVISVLNDRTKPLSGAYFYGAILPGLVCSIVAIWKIVDFYRAMSAIGNISIPGGVANPFADAFGSGVSIGFGLYIVILAGLSIVASAYLLKEEPKTE